jgi:glycoprotein endo-alpha-1,2-mannosidase
MKSTYTSSLLFLAITLAIITSCASDDAVSSTEPKPVTKTNSTKVYMHYMPWYQSKDISGYWGSHWRMTNRNPDIVDETGKRQIASHYYPLIGPYDSRDPDVIDYHLLLMKYAGIDGILIDWYGSHAVYDYRANLLGSNAVIDRLDDAALQFAIVYEEYTAENVAAQMSKPAITAAREDMAYMQTNYFSKEEYIHVDDAPMLLTFGPRYFRQAAQWTEIFQGLTTAPVFLPLWDHGGLTGDTDSGEFGWVDFNTDLRVMDNFYRKSSYLPVLMGSAYPRFHDYYEEGGTGTSYGTIPFNEGATLQATLAKAMEFDAKYLQLVTWNDYGEGTVIEPTREDGFRCLTMIQQFTGVPYGEAELQLIHTYYQKKIAYKDDTTARQTLERVYGLLVSLQPEAAKDLLATLP